jgi:ABC-type bacteriocin/lantibiotic exporter with double-glycine peptidase domain
MMKSVIERLIKTENISIDWDAFNRLSFNNNESLIAEVNHLVNDPFFNAQLALKSIKYESDLPDSFIILSDEPKLIRRVGVEYLNQENKLVHFDMLRSVGIVFMTMAPKKITSKDFIQSLISLYPKSNFLLLLLVPFALIPAFYANLFNTRLIFNDSIYTLLFITIVFSGLWSLDYFGRLFVKNKSLSVLDDNSLRIEKFLFSLMPHFRSHSVISKIRTIESSKKTLWDSMSGAIVDVTTFLLIISVLFVLIGYLALLLLLFYFMVAIAAVYLRYKNYKIYLELDAEQQDLLLERLSYTNNKQQLSFYNKSLMSRHFLGSCNKSFKVEHDISKFNFDWDEFVRFSAFLSSLVLFSVIFYTSKSDPAIFGVLIALLILNGRASASVVGFVSKAFYGLSAMYHIDLAAIDLLEKNDNRAFNKGISISEIKRIDLKSVSVLAEGKKILDQVSLSLEAGKIYGLYGNVGTGKSLLLKSIVQLHQEYQGTMLFNELYDARDLDMSVFSSLVGYLDPNTDFIRGSIFYNFDIRGNRDSHEVARLTKLVFPGVAVDYDFLFQKDILQIPMSTGQRRKLLIYMTINKSKQMLIFDEALVNLTMVDILDLFQYINNSFSSGIVIIVSHDRNLLGLIPEVFELRDMKLHHRKSAVVKVA